MHFVRRVARRVIVRFNHHDDVPRPRERRSMDVTALEVFDRGNDATEQGPGLQTFGQQRLRAVKSSGILYRLKLESEFLPHFVQPLRNEAGGHD